MRIKWKNVINAAVVLASLALMAWFVGSWIDAIIHQWSGNPSNWNVFPLIMQWLGH